MSLRSGIVTTCALILAGLAAPFAGAAEPQDEPTFEEIYAQTERFQDVKAALAEGYVPAPGEMCEAAGHMGMPEHLGAMGVHYFRPDLLGITAPPNPRVDGNGTHTDFRKPAILIYEPQKDGSLQLVAVENLVFQKAWAAAGHTAPPTYAGKAFDLMVDDPKTPADEAHGFEPHYDLHVWLYRANPNGVFAQFNPKVTCDYKPMQVAHQHGH